MAETNTSGGETRYKIGDVCRIADVQPYVLRYWESEFPVLAPDKSTPGPRTYSARELQLVEQIKRLLYDEGYTIAGAKKRLEADAGGKAEAKGATADTNPVAPPPEEPARRPAKTETPARADKAQKGSRAPRPSKAALAVFSAAPDIELPGGEVELPGPEADAPGPEIESAAPTAEPPAREIPQQAAQPPADTRVARAVAELKEVLALLSRPLS